ncbi:MAG: hypothetical protein RL386_1213, partial [Bacteroidota bacterium]
ANDPPAQAAQLAAGDLDFIAGGKGVLGDLDGIFGVADLTDDGQLARTEHNGRFVEADETDDVGDFHNLLLQLGPHPHKNVTAEQYDLHELQAVAPLMVLLLRRDADFNLRVQGGNVFAYFFFAPRHNVQGMPLDLHIFRAHRVKRVQAGA